ncbi:MAG: pyridoxal phosphate-dependent decarboxylase family protein [Gemmatimonadaceae bacterium]
MRYPPEDLEEHMESVTLGDMPPEEFRENGHRLVDWIADYFDWSLRNPVLSAVEPGAIRAALPDSPPEQGEPFERALADFERVLVPGLTQWNHPGYFAYFPCGFSGAGVLADFLSTAVSQQAMLWRTSPAATELEEVTLGWLRQALGLPAAFEGVIYDTASTSTLHALAVARHAAAPEIGVGGFVANAQRPFRVYCSEHAHSSVDKAAAVLGLGHENVRRIPTDAAYRMRAEALAAAVEEDLHGGAVPLAVVATVGTTSAGSVDPVPAIADLCAKYDLWLHVDAAYAGAAAIVPECRWAMEGAEHADSLVVNPHKWLFTPLDLSVLYCRRMDVLRDTFSLTPEYLRTPEAPVVRNLMDTGFQLGRRFRALKLWMVMRYFGVEGLRARLREHMRLARLFAEWVAADPGFELAAPVSFGVVCFRAVQGGAATPEDEDALNERLLTALNDTGEMFLSHTRLGGRYVMRLAIGNIRTTEAEVRRVWERLREKAVGEEAMGLALPR